MKITQGASWLLLLLAACGDEAAPHDGASGAEQQLSVPTFYDDMVPIFEKSCNQCHRAGGGAPFRLDDYASAKTMAHAVQHATESRHMPPWSVTSDGSCGDFADSIALTPAQIERIADWVEGGAKAGTPRPIAPPKSDGLTSAVELATPTFFPVVQGGELAASDEYRCFDLTTARDRQTFITGYDVLPGTPEIIHHVVVSLVDPSAPAEVPDRPGLTNAQLMAELRASSPEREGWPCYNAAGEGVAIDSVPVTWAPGQGVVRYPNASGIPLKPTHRVIVQVHYNLADPTRRGASDRTLVRLQTDEQVENVGVFTHPDPLIESLFTGEAISLPPGRSSAPFTWKQSLEQIGMSALPGLQLAGVMPHMHQLGRKYQMRIVEGDQSSCAADVQHWDFHWQRMYFYQKPIPMTATTQLEVTCDFDTSERTTPVLPGWGTQNEMCLATLYFTVPLATYEAATR